MQFYVKDIDGKESNRLDFTLRNDKNFAKDNTATTTINNISSSSVMSSTTTATNTINGVTSLNAKVKDKLNFVWGSSNADTFSMAVTVTSCSDSTHNEARKVDNVSSGGSSHGVIPVSFSGCTIAYVFTVKNTKTGNTAIAKATVKISRLGK